MSVYVQFLLHSNCDGEEKNEYCFAHVIRKWLCPLMCLSLHEIQLLSFTGSRDYYQPYCRSDKMAVNGAQDELSLRCG